MSIQKRRINLRNKPGTYRAQLSTHERSAELCLMPGVDLKIGDNIIDLDWFEKLPVGYRNQVDEWIALGWVERLPVEEGASS